MFVQLPNYLPLKSCLKNIPNFSLKTKFPLKIMRILTIPPLLSIPAQCHLKLFSPFSPTLSSNHHLLLILLHTSNSISDNGREQNIIISISNNGRGPSSSPSLSNGREPTFLHRQRTSTSSS